MKNISLDYFEQLNGEFEKKDFIFSSSLIKQPYAIESLFVIRVEGQSMEPLIQHDSLVVADLSQKYFEEDRIFLIYKDDRMWIKKASLIDDKQYFVSINKGYEHLLYELSEVRIVAKALLTFTAL